MAAIQAKCPEHGEWSDGTAKTNVSPTEGLTWHYHFPCCSRELVIRGTRSASPATRDVPFVPTQRDTKEF